MMIKVNTVQKVNAPKKSHHNLFLQLRKEQIDPITMMKNFEKTDDDNIRALKFDILLQSENLLNKLAERRKKQDLKNEGKRQSIFTPGNKGQAFSKSFFTKEAEDTLATDSYPNTGNENPSSFAHEVNDDHEFKEIFKVLDELEDDSNIFGNINNNFGTEGKHEDEQITKEDEKREEYEQKKERFLEQYKINKDQQVAEIKKTYDDEVSKLNKQEKNSLTKSMIKNIKKERDEAVERVKAKFKTQKDEFLEKLKQDYNITE